VIGRNARGPENIVWDLNEGSSVNNTRCRAAQKGRKKKEIIHRHAKEKKISYVLTAEGEKAQGKNTEKKRGDADSMKKRGGGKRKMGA